MVDICCINRQALGFFPTPFHELTQLGRVLKGPRVFIKRDDQAGLALGGNKTRKLEYILGDAVSKGADTIVTAGATQSNHCRQTAAAAAKLQLECHLVLGGVAPGVPSGNLLLNHLFGSHIHWAGENRKGEDIPEIVEQLLAEGKRPYVAPYGGSSVLGAVAFVEALKELDQQLLMLEESVTHIVFASSSGGTHAGMMVGKRWLNAHYELIGINIDKGVSGKQPFGESIIALANETAQYLDVAYEFSHDDLLLNNDYVGEGYGVVGDLENEAISLMAKTEGVLLDPVYTGRAMGGLINLIRSGYFKSTDRVLFWHTGGTPALFAFDYRAESGGV